MRKFNPAISLVKDTEGNYTEVQYTFFAPGKVYSQQSVTQVQITSYDAEEQEVPGIKVTIELSDEGSGNPFVFSGSFAINTSLVLDNEKPYLDLGIYVLNPTTQQLERKGGGMVRHEDSDSEG